MSDVDAAIPERLIAWASWAGPRDQSLVSLARNLDATIEAFNATPQSPRYITLPYPGNDLASFAAQNGVIDAWVGKVGQAFKTADEATGPAKGSSWEDLSGGALAALAGPMPTRRAAQAGKGASLVEQLEEEAAQPGNGSIGSQNGLPASTRDKRNRKTLEEEIELLEAAPPSSSRNALLAAAEGVSEALAQAPAGASSYLLDLDLAKGEAIIAYGNPDTAQNTAVYVPGTGASLAGMPSDSAIAHLYQQAHEDDPNATLSTIEWLGYAAPPNLRSAGLERPAENGAKPLDEFMTGLRESHEGPPSNTTLIGHSYGSLVVGLAAKQTQAIANSIVLVGSPGAGVEHASQLNIAPGHVWAAHNDLDVVSDGTDYARLPGDLFMPLLGDPPIQSWFGADPTSPGFGARDFSTGGLNAGDTGSVPEIHHDYFASDSESLLNIARIVDGSHP